ncbi:hypothetical protein RHECNPAF_4090036 [Rhizobium etli CNPAF512]|nr:hypothetical protein RHECNPAF_4090036 [Rhizobium etli CNPAF512]
MASHPFAIMRQRSRTDVSGLVHRLFVEEMRGKASRSSSEPAPLQPRPTLSVGRHAPIVNAPIETDGDFQHDDIVVDGRSLFRL